MPVLLAGMTAPSYPASSNVMAPLDNESPVQLQVGQNASSMGDVASYHVANPMAHHLPMVQIILINSGQRSLVGLPRECPSETPVLVIGTASTNKLHKAACSPKHARSWKEATGETLLDLSRSSVAMRTGQT